MYEIDTAEPHSVVYSRARAKFNSTAVEICSECDEASECEPNGDSRFLWLRIGSASAQYGCEPNERTTQQLQQQQQQRSAQSRDSCYKWKLVGKCGNAASPHTIHNASAPSMYVDAATLSLARFGVCLFGRSHCEPRRVCVCV